MQERNTAADLILFYEEILLFVQTMLLVISQKEIIFSKKARFFLDTFLGLIVAFLGDLMDSFIPTEINILSQFRHMHLVPLIGYCNENIKMIMVYE
ncbi:unnamed protein product [Brassica rapa subsp. narinosa]